MIYDLMMHWSALFAMQILHAVYFFRDDDIFILASAVHCKYQQACWRLVSDDLVHKQVYMAGCTVRACFHLGSFLAIMTLHGLVE